MTSLRKIAVAEGIAFPCPGLAVHKNYGAGGSSDEDEGMRSGYGQENRTISSRWHHQQLHPSYQWLPLINNRDFSMRKDCLSAIRSIEVLAVSLSATDSLTPLSASALPLGPGP